MQSNLGINDISMTPSGIMVNLINPNPGNVVSNNPSAVGNMLQVGSSQTIGAGLKRKRSSSNSNLNIQMSSASST